MNSNSTLRQLTQKRADELSAVYPEIIKTEKFNNFDVAYYDFPLKQILVPWRKQGGHLVLLLLLSVP
jgi:DNA-directed RNA polymerase subunit K/omega